MEQFVLGIFQEQLSKFIVGFRKEQVNANLLNGKGEIHNVELNCAVLNEELAKVTPYIQLEDVWVSKLSFHVSSWTNIRKAPIVVDVEHVTATIVEPLTFRERSARRRIQQISNGELIDMIRAGLVQPGKNPYNLFDRILDNLTVEIASITIRYQTWGKFKTRRSGPWTPPEVHVRLGSLRLVSVNEFGQEAPPEEVWRHNHGRRCGSFLLYKKLEMEYQVAIQPASSGEPIVLMTGTENKVEVHMAVQRRIKDAAWLSVQIDVTIPHVNIDIPFHVVPLLYQVASGIQYCLAKDRAFVDPLKPVSQTSHQNSLLTTHVTVEGDTSESEGDPPHSNNGFMPEGIGIDEEAISSDEEEGEERKDDTPSGHTLASSESRPQNPVRLSSRKSNLLDADSRDKPLILLPKGIIIYDKVSLSLSIHEVSLKGSYEPSRNGYIEMVVKGMVSEAIWPVVTHEKGGYLQASVSYISLEEKHDTRIRQILVGGVKFDGSGPPEDAKKPLLEVLTDESFPLYEERSLRPDPLGLRHSFPAQAFGFKASLDFVTRDLSCRDGAIEEIQVLNEIGIERFNIVLDSMAWGRALRYALNETGDGFDPRWHTGDWSAELTSDMLVQGSGRLKLDESLQPTKDIFLDENQMISSDLFNLTMRVTDVTMRIPAMIQGSLRSADVVLFTGETTVVVSSALPRTMLSGRIGTAVNGDNSKAENIDFPNDPSDIPYQLERQEDPSKRQRGKATSKPISTFRAQITCRGFFIKLVPIIPSYRSSESQMLLSPSEFSALLCFEGEPADSSSTGSSRMTLFVSIVVHRCIVNLNFDLLDALLCTASGHALHVKEVVDACQGLIRDESMRRTPGRESYSTLVQKSLNGRKLIVERQMERSRQNGGLSVAFCMQIAELAIYLWSPSHVKHQLEKGDGSEGSLFSLDLVQLAKAEVSGLELGVEGFFQGDSRHLVLKVCLSTAIIGGRDIRSIEDEKGRQYETMIAFLAVGEAGSGDLNSNSNFSLRVEETTKPDRNWSLSTNISQGNFILDVGGIEELCILMAQAATANDLRRSIMEGLKPVLSRLRGSKGLVIRTLSDLEPVMHAMVRSCIPSDLGLLLMNVEIHDTDVNFGRRGGEGCVTLKIDETNFRFGSLLVESSTTSKLLALRASRGQAWSDIMKISCENRLLHSMVSSQSLLFNGSSPSSIVAPFTFGYRYEGDVTKVIAPEKGVRLGNLKEIRRALDYAEAFMREAFSLSRTMKNLLGDPRRTEQRDESFFAVMSKRFDTVLANLDAVCANLDKVGETIASQEHTLLSWRSHYERRVEELQKLCFQKERERIGALALVSAEVAGWLRLGAAQRTGQRRSLTCTLWPYWCLLRKSLLIVYKRPGSTEVVEVIPISGALLEELSGARKRDLKRAMALTESSGMVRLMMAGSDREYFMWVNGFMRYAESPPALPMDQNLSSNVSGNSVDMNDDSLGSADRDVEGADEGQSRFARVAQVARATREKAIAAKQAVAHRQKRGSVEAIEKPSEPGALEFESTSENMLGGVGQAAKARFSTSGQATKSRFGNAFSAARQKGKQAMEKTRSRLGGVEEISDVTARSEHDSVDNPLPENSIAIEDTVHASPTPESVSDYTNKTTMRQRLGKAVQSVRRNPNLNDDDDLREYPAGAPRSVRLKNVVTASPISKPTHVNQALSTDEMPLRRLQHNWVVEVEAEELVLEEEINIDECFQDIVETVFVIRSFCVDSQGNGTSPKAETKANCPQILACHTALSESASRFLSVESLPLAGRRDSAGAMQESVARALGVSALDAVKLTGCMLESLLSQEGARSQTTRNFEAIMVREFLNSMLQTALPVDAFFILMDFLGIPKEAVSSIHANDKTDRMHLSAETKMPPSSIGIISLLTSAKNKLSATRDLVGLARTIATAKAPSESPCVEQFPIAPQPARTASDAFHEAVHTVLMQVMAERDESHARMVAAGVLHLHEVEQLRKQVTRLTAQLEAGTSGDPEGEARVQTLKREMQQDSDMELVSLCQQLAGEISSKTNASLEVLRLKESREIERTTEDAEKKALAKQAQDATEALSKERTRAEKAEAELEHWKASYVNLVEEEERKILEKHVENPNPN